MSAGPGVVACGDAQKVELGVAVCVVLVDGAGGTQMARVLGAIQVPTSVVTDRTPRAA